MARKLTDTEIKHRLQQLRNITHLHGVARDRLEQALATIKDLRLQLASKDERIAELEVQLLDKESQRKELAAKLWKAGKRHKAQAAEQVQANGSSVPTTQPTRKPGAQPGHPAASRPLPAPDTITDRQIFDLSVCPSCKHAVGDEVDKVEKYQEDIDLAPRNKIVRHYTITRHWCGHCQEYVRPVNTPAQNLRRFGPNVMGYILYARYRLRLPLLKIQESLNDLHDFQLSEGEIQHQLNEARDSFGDQYDLICELIKSAKIVYADESGWRMDGDNWYIWAFVSPEDGAIRYEVVDTRGGGIAKEALGDKADRVIVSDGYTAYGSLPGFNQQCWVHLLRVAKAKTRQLYGELCAVYSLLLLELEKPLDQRNKQRFSDQLTSLQTKTYRHQTEPLAPEVQARIARHHDQLLVCLDHEGVLPENNTAERAIRPQVILRKIFGGNRSPTGAKTHAVNTSVIATKLTQNPGQTFFEVMLPLIQEAHAKAKVKPKPAPG
jgi:transposase